MRHYRFRAPSPLLSSVSPTFCRNSRLKASFFFRDSTKVRKATCLAPLLLAVALGLTSSARATDFRSERMIAPGVKCITLTRDTGPWVIRIIEADGQSGYIRAGVTYASERGLKAAPVSAQATRASTETR